jgi:methionyl aminopeptidase
VFTRVKTEFEIQAMRESGKILASVLKKIEQTASAGMTGKDVSALASKELKALGGQASFYGYMGFPDVICISVNDAVVHGIPNSKEFKEGDIVGFDFGVTYKGMITDSALSMAIGKTDAAGQKLLTQTERSLYAGIEQVKGGVRTGDIGFAVQKVLNAAGLGIVKDLVGHGVGHEVHEDPNVPNYGSAGVGTALKTGMTIAIEPMATLGGGKVIIDEDGWTVRTLDETLAAHFEHTVLITQSGYEILTQR